MGNIKKRLFSNVQIKLSKNSLEPPMYSYPELSYVHHSLVINFTICIYNQIHTPTLQTQLMLALLRFLLVVPLLLEF